MKLLVHASGYRTVPPWTSDQQEISCTLDPRCGGIAACHWSPASRDFAAVGTRSGGSSAAATIDELLAVITGQNPESIEELRILGHANDQVFSLAGDVKRDDVYFTDDKALIGPFPEFKSAVPRFQAVQDRFTADAKIVLMGCNAGTGVDASSPGLTVRKADKSMMMIDVKPEWGSKTAPRNLKDRVAEMGRALELVKKQQAGSIAMK